MPRPLLQVPVVPHAEDIPEVLSDRGLQLKSGMANPVTLADGSVVSELNGEWDAIFDNGRFEVSEDIIKITQEGNKFVGFNSTLSD